MAGARLGDCIEMQEGRIKRACSLAMKAHKSTGKPYILEKSRSSPDAVFSFAGSWSVNDWFAGKSFGEKKIDIGLFPSLRSIGNDEVAVVNEAFLRRFEAILEKQSFQSEVQKAVTEKKQVVFTGHSSGGPMAILAMLWFLEKCPKPENNQIHPLCVTFGSPLVGDRIFPHALNRENWSRYFIHFVMKYDIVPRIFLAPLSSIERELQSILHSFNPKSQLFGQPSNASAFYVNVMRNASTVASHAACNLMGCTNLLLETVTSFIELSPYRPFGSYIFCTGNGKLVVVKNPDAVLQLLFYCPQLSSESESETECAEIADRSLGDHLVYENELQESLQMQSVVSLDRLEELPLSSDGVAYGDIVAINAALDDLGLSTRARLSLRAAGELGKQRKKNQTKIDGNKDKIEDCLNWLKKYQDRCEAGRVSYYDSFKLSKNSDDFQANVKRLELAGMWDEIIEMLKRYELPDEFEGRREWIDLATRFRRILEPLDIANYYRRLKNEDTGPYLIKARPKRYRYTQRWLEHAQKKPKPNEFSSESCFWAEVEEHWIRTRNKVQFENVKEKILQLEKHVLTWVKRGELGKDVFLEKSTFVEWWNTLPPQHRSGSCIADFMNR
ncbi:hypothetical protein L1049_027364 [Liquidambar formosana]|uniref:Enhanced disease susceptibility 1 n=1 Tax=Liquidambar formosana TaxID=63359 RepID=A0AAP0WVB7_LIQFO